MVATRPQPIQLATVKGAEIFGAGVYKGKPYTIADLDEMVANFERLGPDGLNLLQPPAVLGHEEFQEHLERTDLPAAGWLKNLRRVGSLLIGDFAEVPASIARMLQSKAYRKVSCEVYDDFQDDTGKGYGKAIRRVALLGAEIPQVKRLADLPAVSFCDVPVVLKCGECFTSSKNGTFICFSEVTVDRPALVAAVKAAMPNFDQAILDSLTDDQLAALVANLPAPAAPAETPPAMMADVSREDMIADLVAAGEDPARLDTLPDEEIKALYDTLTGGATAEMADVDGVEMSREEMLAALVATGTDPASLESLSDEELAAMLRKPAAPVTPLSERAKAKTVQRPAAKSVVSAFSETQRIVAKTKALHDSADAREKRAIERERKAKRQTAEIFCDQLVREGRVLPVHKATFVNELMSLDDVKIVKFSDNGKEVQATPFDKRKAELAAGPKIVDRKSVV